MWKKWRWKKIVPLNHRWESKAKWEESNTIGTVRTEIESKGRKECADREGVRKTRWRKEVSGHGTELATKDKCQP